MKTERDNVELLRAWEDGTWDVESYDCPVDVTAPNAEVLIMSWCNKTLAPQTRHRKVVLFAIYAIHPDGFNPED